MIVENVKLRRYGNSFLDVIGTGLFYRALMLENSIKKRVSQKFLNNQQICSLLQRLKFDESFVFIQSIRSEEKRRLRFISSDGRSRRHASIMDGPALRLRR